MSTDVLSEQLPPVPVSVPGDFGWDLGMVLRAYQTKFEKAVEDIPGGIRGFQVLSAVVHKGPPNQQAIGFHLGIDRTVLTYLLDTMVDAGVVERVPDPADRRARKIVATAEGERTLQAYEERVRRAEDELLAGMSPDEAEVLTALMGTLARQAHRSHPGVSPCEAMDHL